MLTFFFISTKTTHIVSTSSDTTVRVWDIETGKQTMISKNIYYLLKLKYVFNFQYDSRQIYYCMGAAMVGIVIENNKRIAVGDSLGYLYILEIQDVGK